MQSLDDARYRLRLAEGFLLSLCLCGFLPLVDFLFSRRR